MALNMALVRRSRCMEALGRLPSQRGLPLALLLLALATLFLFVDHGHFYRLVGHDWLSSKNLALTENLTPQRPFVRFHHLEPDEDGNPVPRHLYNRFPIGGYWLIKLATLPFEGDLAAKTLAARTLMLACFAAAAILAFLALARTVGSRWVACGATALAFSSCYCLYYSDMISTEVPMDLFAVMLAFHGMAVFVQEQGRFPQLLVKTCVALALGWHVYALLLPFIAFSSASDLISAHRAAPPRVGSKIRHFSAALFLGRPFTLGVVAFMFGVLVLSANFAGEYHALDEPTSVADLPSWRSMMMRTGQDPEFASWHEHALSWPVFLESQFRNLGKMFLPYALLDHAGVRPPVAVHDAEVWMGGFLFPFGIAALAACLAWLCFSRQRVLLATLTLFGLVWSLPMRHSVAFHNFESVYYVGVPLTLFALTLLLMRKLSGERPVAVVAVVALLVLVSSNWQMNSATENVAKRMFDAEVMRDFDAIRSQTAGGSIGVMLIDDRTGAIGPNLAYSGSIPKKIGAPFALEYYLSQRAIRPLRWSTVPSVDTEKLDFIVTDWREPATLTPENRRFHLYRRNDFINSGLRYALPSNLLAQSKFDIYRHEDMLFHVKSPCTDADVAARFVLHVRPVDSAVLPDYRRQHGYDNFDFVFSERGARFERRGVQTCMAGTKLPGYDIATVSTGQYDESGRIWWLDIPLAR